jgi:hypothetical protein
MARTSYKKDGNKYYKIYLGSVLEIDLTLSPEVITIRFDKLRETNLSNDSRTNRKKNIKRAAFEKIYLQVIQDLGKYVKKSIHPKK